jgi:hypothetical protein
MHSQHLTDTSTAKRRHCTACKPKPCHLPILSSTLPTDQECKTVMLRWFLNSTCHKTDL